VIRYGPQAIVSPVNGDTTGVALLAQADEVAKRSTPERVMRGLISEKASPDESAGGGDLLPKGEVTFVLPFAASRALVGRNKGDILLYRMSA